MRNCSGKYVKLMLPAGNTLTVVNRTALIDLLVVVQALGPFPIVPAGNAFRLVANAAAKRCAANDTMFSNMRRVKTHARRTREGQESHLDATPHALKAASSSSFVTEV